MKKISLLHIVAALSSTNPIRIDFAEAPVSQKSVSFLRLMHMSKYMQQLDRLILAKT